MNMIRECPSTGIHSSVDNNKGRQLQAIFKCNCTMKSNSRESPSAFVSHRTHCDKYTNVRQSVVRFPMSFIDQPNIGVVNSESTELITEIYANTV